MDVDGQLCSQLLDVKTDVEWSRGVSDVCLFSTGDQLVVLVEMRRDPPGLPGHCPQCRDDPPGLPGHCPQCRDDPSSAIVLVGDCEVTVLCRTACLYSEETVLLSADGWGDVDQLLADAGHEYSTPRLGGLRRTSCWSWASACSLSSCWAQHSVLLIRRQTRGEDKIAGGPSGSGDQPVVDELLHEVASYRLHGKCSSISLYSATSSDS